MGFCFFLVDGLGFLLGGGGANWLGLVVFMGVLGGVCVWWGFGNGGG